MRLTESHGEKTSLSIQAAKPQTRRSERMSLPACLAVWKVSDYHRLLQVRADSGSRKSFKLHLPDAGPAVLNTTLSPPAELVGTRTPCKQISRQDTFTATLTGVRRTSRSLNHDKPLTLLGAPA
jgi:hypothetical protein